MELTFGKHKGKTVDTLAKSKEGRQYLQWLINQPEEGQYAAKNKARNDYIRKALKMSNGDDSGAKNGNSAQSSPIPESLIIQKLDTIIELLSKKGVAWDD